MSELIDHYPGDGYEAWVKWYKDQRPGALEEATERVYSMILKLQEALNSIDRTLVERWVHDLVLAKTYVGFRFQEAILTAAGRRLDRSIQRANPTDESKGIDGYI